MKLSELRELEKKATPGPWIRDTNRPHTVLTINDLVIGGILYNTNAGDVHFIAAARNALPELLDLLDECRNLVQRFMEQAGHDQDFEDCNKLLEKLES